MRRWWEIGGNSRPTGLAEVGQPLTVTTWANSLQPTSSGNQEHPQKKAVSNGNNPRPTGLTFSKHVPIFCVEAKQPTYMLKVHASVQEPPWKHYKRSSLPHLEDTPFGEKKSIKQDVVHL